MAVHAVVDGKLHARLEDVPGVVAGVIVVVSDAIAVDRRVAEAPGDDVVGVWATLEPPVDHELHQVVQEVANYTRVAKTSLA